jgi:hypothetical protein
MNERRADDKWDAGETRSATRRACCDGESCTRGDISFVSEHKSPLPDRVRGIACAVAWTSEKLRPEIVGLFFSRWFQLPLECMFCDEFVRTYQDEVLRAFHTTHQD